MQHGMPNGTLLIAKISETWFRKSRETGKGKQKKLSTLLMIIFFRFSWRIIIALRTECVYLFVGVWKWFIEDVLG